MTVKQIIRAVSREASAFRRNTKKLTGSKVYGMAHDIQITEDIAYVICEYPQYYEDNENTLIVLSKFCAEGRLLSEFRKWASSQDSLDMSNIYKASDTLDVFCSEFAGAITEEAEKL